MWRRVGSLALVVLLGVVAGARGAAPPADAVAWWRSDPRRFGSVRAPEPGRGVVEAVLRAAARSGLAGDGDAGAIVRALLAASVVGGTEHTLCILDLEVPDLEVPEARGDGLTLRAVLELVGGGGHEEYVRTIESVLGGPAGAGAQRRLVLPGGIAGVAYREEGWPAWREVAWCSTPGAFVVGLGPGALERWFSEAPGAEGESAAHRRQVDGARPAGGVCVEAYVDVNALRRGCPSLFTDDGRGSRLLRAWHLQNARAAMVHARWADVPGGPPLLAIDATWSRRSDPPGSVLRQQVSLDSWPVGEDGPVVPRPPGSYAIVVPVDAERWLSLGLDTFDALVEADRLPAFREARRRWERQHRGALSRVAKAGAPYLVIADYPPPVLPVPGAASVVWALDRGVTAPGMSEQLERLLVSFRDVVARDEAAGMWTVQVGEASPVALASWGLAGFGPEGADRRRQALVGGFGGPGVVEALRAWLRGAAP